MGVYDEDDNFSSDEEDLTQGNEVAEHVSSDGDGPTCNSNDLDLPDAEVPENDIPVESETESESDEEESNTDSSKNVNSLQNVSNICYSYTPISPALRRRNILREAPGPKANPPDEVSSFRLFHTEEMLSLILRCTNRKISQYNRQNHKTIKPFSKEELLAAIAILYRAGVDRDNFSDMPRLFHPVDSRPFYRAVFSVNRFEQFLRFVRFDNLLTRAERQASDRLAAFSDIWMMFVAELRKNYVPDSDITVDEQLVGYRGRTPGRTYMPMKPRKYGVKIFWATESTTGFALNAKIYTGRMASQEPERDLGRKTVMELLRPYYNSGRNVITDNFFTSFSLAVDLIAKDLTILGTIRKNRREIPRCLIVTNKKPRKI